MVVDLGKLILLYRELVGVLVEMREAEHDFGNRTGTRKVVTNCFKLIKKFFVFYSGEYASCGDKH